MKNKKQETPRQNSGSLVIKGKSGQGIQLLGFILANILKDQGFQVALSSRYSPLVRTGHSRVSLVFTQEKIQNPLVDQADWEYNLEQKNFQKELLEKYPNPKVLNMTLLGFILQKLGINLAQKSLKRYLPTKFLAENLKAIQAGRSATKSIVRK